MNDVDLILESYFDLSYLFNVSFVFLFESLQSIVGQFMLVVKVLCFSMKLVPKILINGVHAVIKLFTKLALDVGNFDIYRIAYFRVEGFLLGLYP